MRFKPSVAHSDMLRFARTACRHRLVCPAEFFCVTAAKHDELNEHVHSISFVLPLTGTVESSHSFVAKARAALGSADATACQQ